MEHMENEELLRGEPVDDTDSEEKQHVHQTIVHVHVGAEEYGETLSEEQQLHGNSEPELETEPQPVTAEISVDGNLYSEQELQQQLLLKEEELTCAFERKLSENEIKWAAQLQAVETSRQNQTSEFAAEIERLKLLYSEEVENALVATRQAQEELARLRANHAKEIECTLAESEKAHVAELQVLRAEIEQLCTERDSKKQEDSKEAWESLVPKLSPQLSPQLQKELRLQKERLQRLHRCDLKAQEQKLCNELSLENDILQAKLEEEYTRKLAKVLTESALKNASQVEQISQQLRAEKQKALSRLEEEQAARHEQEVASLLEERKEAMEACRKELELARAEYQSKIAELETALATEKEKKMEALREQNKGEWEVRLREEVEVECRRRVEEVRAECDREKEEVLMSQRQALEERLETELRAAHQMHEDALRQNQTQLQSLYDKELAAVKESMHTIPLSPQEDKESQIETIRTEMLTEHTAKLQQITEKLQAVHQAELVAIQQEREIEGVRHQEEMERVREEVEARFHQELEQVSRLHGYSILLM